jgi:DNA polymerase-1
MSKIFDTSGLDEAMMRRLSSDDASHIYNGLDCCVTFEVYERLAEEIAASPENVQHTYNMAIAKQAPFLDISLRGILVDEESRRAAIKKLQAELDLLNGRFQRIMREVFDHELNWRSPVQLKTLFYGTLRIKAIRKRNAKGVFAETVNEEALNRLCLHFWAQPLAQYILLMRDLGKKISFLETEIDYDGRMRCDINIAGTNTGRLSSSMSDFGTGTNMQNVDSALRFPFISDPGYILVNVDLEQADARNVGAIIYNTFYESHGAETAAVYLDACESGDLHTFVCRMAWADLDWPEARAGWREIADQKAYKDMSYRDLAKRLGHGTNYYGTPRTMAKHTQTETHIIELFQSRYFAAFPLIPEWHRWTIEEIKSSGVLTTLYGRRRHFWGRGNDASTWRKAIAYCPQSMTAHQIDMGILNLWRNMPEAQLLMQVHDSVLFQLPFRQLETLLPRAMELLRFAIELKGGRKFAVPLEAQVGWNWGKVEYKDKKVAGNPYGLITWRGSEERLPPPTKRLKDYI